MAIDFGPRAGRRIDMQGAELSGLQQHDRKSNMDFGATWEKVLDASHNGIAVIDRHGLIVAYNEAARRIFNDRNASIVGRHFSEVRPEAWPDLEEVLRSGQAQIGRKITLPQATIIANRSPIYADGKIVGVISVFQDISEYDNMSSQLQSYQKLHRELEAIIETSDDGLYITDGQADTLRVNKSYERITGLSRDDLIGRNMHELVDAKVFDHSVTLEVLQKRSKVSILQNIKGDKQVLVTGNPIFDEQGRIAYVVTSVRDVTQLNELQSQLENSRRVSSRFYQILLEQEGWEHALDKLIVKSEPMATAVRKAIRVARTDTSVILYGESGVGKSMLARIIHQISARKDGPFMKINCGTIPDSLMESELFGYVTGAFTGAVQGGKAGLIEAGHGGTVFFDEIGDLGLAMQVKLLEVIEEKTFMRVGSTSPSHVNVRIVAATNRDLKDLVGAGRFRQDLYYRLNVVPIRIPPLRERLEDVPVLVLDVLSKINQSRRMNKRLGPDVMAQLQTYDYPGNVRELINLIERMIIMSEGDTIGLENLPAEVRCASPDFQRFRTQKMPLAQAVQAFERYMIQETMKRHKSPAQAAKELGIHYSTLWRKLGKSQTTC